MTYRRFCSLTGLGVVLLMVAFWAIATPTLHHAHEAIETVNPSAVHSHPHSHPHTHSHPHSHAHSHVQQHNHGEITSGETHAHISILGYVLTIRLPQWQRGMAVPVLTASSEWNDAPAEQAMTSCERWHIYSNSVSSLSQLFDLNWVFERHGVEVCGDDSLHRIAGRLLNFPYRLSDTPPTPPPEYS